MAPKPGLGGCSPSFTSFTNDTGPDNGLISWLNDGANAAQVSKAGVIWVESSYAPLGGEISEILIQGTAVAGSMETFALTINGGWIGGTAGLTTLNPNAPSQFNVPFRITGWGGAVTINNIAISGASGAGISALEVVSNGSITANNVDVGNTTTQYGGAYFTSPSLTSTITVNDSTFNNNGGTSGTGLFVLSNGIITIKNVTASGNGADGVYLSNGGSATPKTISVNGTNYFNGNNNVGLVAYSKGAITLNNITANDNGTMGVRVDNCSYSTSTEFCNFTAGSGVTIKGNNQFNNNGWDGLRVFSGGVITANSLTAIGNGTVGSRPAANATGEFLDEYDAQGKGIFLHNYGAIVPRAITLTGVNIFNNNASDGLFAYGWGAITVSNITASANGCDPAKDTNTEICAGAYLNGSTVSQSGYGFFNDNAESGLGVIAETSALLTNLHAEGNDGAAGGGPGTFVFSGGNITISGTNVFNNNAGAAGLYMGSDNGIITLNNLTANGNGGVGALADNSNATTAKAINLTGLNTFSYNGGGGFAATSIGAITTNSITAIENGSDGVVLDNCLASGPSCNAPFVAPVTMNGTNFLDGNGGDNLDVTSRGAIKVSNLTSNNASAAGAYLDNQYNNAVGGVTLLGYASTSNNGTRGLLILSRGAILTINITAATNGTGGVVLDNCAVSGFACQASAAVPVTMNGNNFLDANTGDNLVVVSRGAITINNLTTMYAAGATHVGAYLDNQYTNGVGGVTLKGYTYASNNTAAGMEIFSNGLVTLATVTANMNGGVGVAIDNNVSTTIPTGVTITGSNTFNDNATSGLQISSYGIVSLSNLTASNNGNPAGGYGVYIDNKTGATLSRAVTITGVNSFNNNFTDGLSIQSLGAVVINSVQANGNLNGGNGVSVDNFSASFNFAAPVTISGYGMFNDNAGYGLYIDTEGNASLINLTALGNGGDGAYVHAVNGLAAKQSMVTITGNNTFHGNAFNGLSVSSDGAITLNNILASQNTNSGASLENSIFDTAKSNITLLGTNTFNGNGQTGLVFASLGAVSLTRVSAESNNDATVGVANGITGWAGTGITYTCGSVYNNEGSGYSFTTTTGLVTIKGVYSYGNGATNASSPVAVITRACPLP